MYLHAHPGSYHRQSTVAPAQRRTCDVQQPFIDHAPAWKLDVVAEEAAEEVVLLLLLVLRPWVRRGPLRPHPPRTLRPEIGKEKKHTRYVDALRQPQHQRTYRHQSTPGHALAHGGTSASIARGGHFFQDPLLEARCCWTLGGRNGRSGRGSGRGEASEQKGHPVPPKAFARALTRPRGRSGQRTRMGKLSICEVLLAAAGRCGERQVKSQKSRESIERRKQRQSEKRK
ncbi:hypothetical protein B0H11DRAFT_1899879 [Mycena galericulata]|nr:hypothetical protein B0H11DRAFT_1899879 [Mycena galericulata]